MMTLTIDSQVKTLDACLGARTQHAIKNEPMLFNCDHHHAHLSGGPITRDFLGLLPEDWRNSDVPLVIDSRSHMLMPGWYPCIPGWHHDDVPRTRVDGQPNYGPGQPRSRHIIALVGGEICPTEFALGLASFVEPAIGRTIYEDWHPQVDALVRNGALTSFHAPSNQLIEFDDRTWHRGTAAVGNGWRFFIRASRYFDPTGAVIERGNERTNEVRKQAQVYMSALEAGW